MRFICLKIMLILHLRAISADSILASLGTRITSAMSKIYSGYDNNVVPDDANNVDAQKKTFPANMIKREKYPVEIHSITTDDGYIVTVFRIPGPSNSTPVYLQHGLLECAGIWLVTGKNKSLAYILADHGYDVWLGNARGNTYARKHTTFSTSDPEFWNFSWQELGTYDLPAVIDYIAKLTGKSVFYIGHSMGATSFSVMAIERPDIAIKVKGMIGLAPATYVYHMKAPINLIAPYWRQFHEFGKKLGANEIFARNGFYDLLSKYVCKSMLLRNILCSGPLFLIAGFSSEQLNYSLLPNIWSLFPAGTSIKLFTHWLQQINVNELRKFDYGETTNMKLYNSTVPPTYDISKIRVPVALIWSENDWLVGSEDVKKFYNQLPLKMGNYKVDDKKFNHFDFVWGVDAPRLVYSKILDLLSARDNEIDRD